MFVIVTLLLKKLIALLKSTKCNFIKQNCVPIILIFSLKKMLGGGGGGIAIN